MPNRTSLRTASGRETLPPCAAIHVSIAARSASFNRTVIGLPIPVAGRPIFLVSEMFDMVNS